MRQALLLFPLGADGASLAERRVAGLRLLDRQVRTLVRAGVEHISVVLPASAQTELTPLTQQLPVQLEFATHGQTPTLPSPDEPYLLLMAEYVHHHSSLTA